MASLGGAYVTVEIRIANGKSARRMDNAIATLVQISADYPWMAELADLAAELRRVRKELTIVPSRRQTTHD